MESIVCSFFTGECEDLLSRLLSDGCANNSLMGTVFLNPFCPFPFLHLFLTKLKFFRRSFLMLNYMTTDIISFYQVEIIRVCFFIHV